MLSKKQAMVLAWPKASYDALICDGAVRSGKTSVMTISFIIWAMERYDQQAFGICGKSVGAVERNIITPIMGVGWMRNRFQMSYNQGANCLTVQYQGRKNRFYVFGGKDETRRFGGKTPVLREIGACKIGSREKRKRSPLRKKKAGVK